MNNPGVSSFIRKWGVERITGQVNQTTKDRLRTVLARAVDEGKSYEQMAKAIEHVFGVAKGSRATMIARTEVGRASNYATKQGYKQAGVEQKEWQATQDNATRDTHSEMDGQVQDIDDEFESPDGGTADYPGDFGDAAEDANCRCGVLPVVGERRLRGNRFRMWKVLEQARHPYDRRLHIAMVVGFEHQRMAVMDAFRPYLQEAA
jgi:SPP1 gp7 family putative phage head morphogenesis protein